MPVSTILLDPAQHPWMRREGLRRLMNAIKTGGGETRFVGGCVRDAILGRMVGDVDLACSLPPEKSAEILTAMGIKIVPTGINHGTITAVADHKGYEITALRRDVETYGRHAKVAYTDNWREDAGRRDFTFNALYADAEGKIYDYFDGRADLAEGHVRFIGDARVRIKEDVLRILRFFRFYAWFGRGVPDEDGLAACRELAGLIPQLSVERIWREVSKLLAAEHPLPSWKLMKEQAILDQFLPEAVHLNRLEGLLTAEKKYDSEPSPLVRLMALLPKNEDTVALVAQRLKLSNREAEKLQRLASLPDHLRGRLDPVPFRRALYEYGADLARAGALLLVAEEPNIDLEPALAVAATWEKPTFPLQGHDILKLGIPAGPKVGSILKATEEWWMGQDFRPGKSECEAEAARKASS